MTSKACIMFAPPPLVQGLFRDPVFAVVAMQCDLEKTAPLVGHKDRTILCDHYLAVANRKNGKRHFGGPGQRVGFINPAPHRCHREQGEVYVQRVSRHEANSIDSTSRF
jgi:hypothetical protein